MFTFKKNLHQARSVTSRKPSGRGIDLSSIVVIVIRARKAHPCIVSSAHLFFPNLHSSQAVKKARLVANVEGESSVDGATMGGMVILGLKVGLGAGSVAGMAVDGGAVALVTGLGGGDGEAVLGKLRLDAEVDAGHVPEDSLVGLGVLELEDIGLVGLGGQLDGDAAAVVVGAPLLGVGAAVRREGMHVADSISDRPRVNGLVQLVDNLHAATAGLGGGGVAAAHHVREGRGEGSKGSSDEGLGEHHFD